MNRRTAIATAAAATMTLLSGFVAVGAHTGALGIGGAATPAVAQPAAVVAAPATTVNPTQTPAASVSTPSSTKATHTPAPPRTYESQGRESDD
jgi:hypothetical protein